MQRLFNRKSGSGGAAGADLANQVNQMRLYYLAYLREVRDGLAANAGSVGGESVSASRMSIMTAPGDLSVGDDDLFADS
jgi:hypothetical protein